MRWLVRLSWEGPCANLCFKMWFLLWKTWRSPARGDYFRLRKTTNIKSPLERKQSLPHSLRSPWDLLPADSSTLLTAKGSVHTTESEHLCSGFHLSGDEIASELRAGVGLWQYRRWSGRAASSSEAPIHPCRKDFSLSSTLAQLVNCWKRLRLTLALLNQGAIRREYRCPVFSPLKSITDAPVTSMGKGLSPYWLKSMIISLTRLA